MTTNAGSNRPKGIKLVNGSTDGTPGSVTRRGKLAEGVPLGKLIKREIVISPDVVMLGQPRSLCAERFRRLKTTIVHRYKDDVQVIVVTSGAPDEGKSTVALNLALAFGAESEGTTLLVDADLRRPKVGSYLHPAPKLGLPEVLSKLAPLDHAVLQLKTPGLEILPAGMKVEDPLELLASPEIDALLQELRRRYKWIIIDSPPIVPFTDADAIGARSDGILLVARSGYVPESIFKQAIASVTSTRILGVVYNDARRSLSDAGKHYDGYYDQYYSKDR